MSRSLFSPSLADLATFKPSMRSDSGQQLGDIGWLNNPYNIREACKLKNVPKSGKSPQFLDPLLLQDVLDFFEFGKNWKFVYPSHSDLVWEKFEIGKILNFGSPPKKT